MNLKKLNKPELLKEAEKIQERFDVLSRKQDAFQNDYANLKDKYNLEKLKVSEITIDRDQFAETLDTIEGLVQGKLWWFKAMSIIRAIAELIKIFKETRSK